MKYFAIAFCAAWAAGLSGCGGAKLSHFDQGVVFYDQGKYEDAAKEFGLALEGGKSRKSSRYNLALCYQEMGKYADARREYAALLAQDEANAGAHVNLADTLRRLGESDEALKHYDRAIQLEPVQAFPHCAKAIFYLDKNSPEANETAFAILQEAVRVEERDSNAQYLYGVILERRGERETACRAFEKAVEHDSKNVDAHVALARHHVADKEYGKALRLYIRAGAVDPTGVEAFLGAAACYRELGDPARSLQSLWRARANSARSARADQEVILSSAELLKREIQNHWKQNGGRELTEEEFARLEADLQSLLNKYNPHGE